MNALLPINTSQTLVFIPRKPLNYCKLVIDNEEVQNEAEEHTSVCYEDGLASINIAFDFQEGQNYTYEIFDLEGELMYRGKIFITAQEPQSYNLQQDLLSI